MTRELVYTSPTTGLPATQSIPDPVVKFLNTGAAHGLTQEEELYITTTTSATPFVQMAQGMEDNRMNGGAYVPNARLNGLEAVLSADAASGATAFTVRQCLTPDGRPIFLANGLYLIMHRRPTDAERLNAFSDTNIGATLVTIGAGYDAGTDGVTIECAALSAAYKKGAIVQAILPETASYDLERGQFGLRYQLEQPSVLTNVSAADGETTPTKTIELTFTPSTQPVARGYMIQILKKGEALTPLYCLEVPEYVPPAEYGSAVEAVVAANSADLVAGTGGVVTLAGLNKYYAPATRTVASLTTGTYFVAVRAVTSLTLDAECRLGNAVVTSVAVA